MPETLLLIPLVAAVALLGLTTVLWRRERRRANRLAGELESERAKRPAPALPPLKAVIQTVSRVRSEGLSEVLRSSFDELAGLAEDAEPELRKLAGRDGTLAILFSDIKNSTSLNEELGDRQWLKVLSAHDGIVRKRVAERGGCIVKGQGDGFMIAFATAADAVAAAVEIQRKLDSGPRRLRGTPIEVRIGIHVGPALEKGGDLFGRNVALAARVAAEAEGGEVLVTAEASEGVAQDGGLVLVAAREVELKGLPGAHALYRVEWQGTEPAAEPA